MLKSRALAAALCAVLALGAGCARAAEGLKLPAATVAIEAQAFAGDGGIRSVTVPAKVRSIGEGAFRDCANLGLAIVPATVESIGEDAFAGCAEDLLICTGAGSAALEYAREHRIDYQAGTVYRALLVGNTYKSSELNRLYGPENDVNAMKSCLLQCGTTGFQVCVRRDLDSDGMLRAIRETFSGAKAEDVSLFYYSGHGELTEDGAGQSALVGDDGSSLLTASALRNALDAIPGRKIVVIDACYSGGFIPESQSDSADAAVHAASTAADGVDAEDAGFAAFADGLIRTFRLRQRGGRADDYFVLTACAKDEVSYEDWEADTSLGQFTSCFVKGCGWDAARRAAKIMAADADGNEVVTLREIAAYTSREVLPLGQHVAVYPEDCGWFGLLRK